MSYFPAIISWVKFQIVIGLNSFFRSEMESRARSKR